MSTDVICTDDIGNVTSLGIRLDGTDGWIATKLKVIDYGSGEVLSFPCNCVFDDGADAGPGSSPSRVLQPAGAPHRNIIYS